MVNVVGRDEAIRDKEFAKIGVWIDKGILRTIPMSLLMLTNWPALNQEELVISTDGRRVTESKMSEVGGTYGIVFYPKPENRSAFLDVVSKLRGKKTILELTNSIEERYRHMNDDDEISKSIKQRGISSMEYERERILTPRYPTDGRINQVLDEAKLDLANVAFSELKSAPYLPQLYALERKRELDND